MTNASVKPVQGHTTPDPLTPETPNPAESPLRDPPGPSEPPPPVDDPAATPGTPPPMREPPADHPPVKLL